MIGNYVLLNVFLAIAVDNITNVHELSKAAEEENEGDDDEGEGSSEDDDDSSGSSSGDKSSDDNSSSNEDSNRVAESESDQNSIDSGIMNGGFEGEDAERGDGGNGGGGGGGGARGEDVNGKNVSFEKQNGNKSSHIDVEATPKYYDTNQV